ncbi:glycerophosphoryl diester phosphodiesterase [Georgenia soli]|uniref:Glycerophosphoryl diester phosphodiesterase n=1 Tax=Georgenia soli TaxID=638953 RepID=A0A2A9EHM1_9MICO|nr:glycerophosphodiester phosphodiesterase family protein [Georgenia soli]PFG38021.1 glycerophosphoryl diester phosphodiesterase [Georgenia soli]
MDAPQTSARAGTPGPVPGPGTPGPWREGVVDLGGHRGARGLVVENTVPSFLRAVALGAGTLELDVQLTADGALVVWHDPVVGADRAVDIGPAVPSDPAFPYAGTAVVDLAFGQLACLDVGRRTLPRFPGQQARPGTRVPLLAEVLHAVREVDPDVWFLVEVKCDPTRPELSSAPADLVAAVAEVVEAAGAGDRVLLESFDWRVLEHARRTAPHLPLVALADDRTFSPGSPWTGTVRFEDHDGDLVSAALALGAVAVAPAYAAPSGATSADPGFRLVTDGAFVERAHAAGLAVVPWTVNAEEDLALVIAAGVDCLITDYPDRAARLLR